MCEHIGEVVVGPSQAELRRSASRAATVMLTGYLVAAPSLGLAADGVMLEEIVVTAQKRDESLRRVPIPVTAISGDVLVAMGAESFLDYALSVPSLSFGFSGVEGRATRNQISIRGVSGTGTAATYVNETLVPTSLNLRLVDVERVEVLRGPQGTLYGSGSMGGLVKVVTRRPDRSAFAGSFAAGTSRTKDSHGLSFSVDSVLNVPFRSEVGAARVAAYFSDESGFIDRTFGEPLPFAPEIPTATLVKGVERDVNAATVRGVRATAVFAPTEAWEIEPTIHWQRTRQDGATDADVSADSRGTQFRSFNIAEPLVETARLAQLTATYQGRSVTFVSATSFWDRKFFEGEDDTETFDAAVRGDYAVSGAPPYPSSITNDWTQESFQQEVRLSGAAGARVDWLVGGYYQSGESLRRIRWSMPGWSADPRYFSPGLGDLLFSTDGGGKSTDRAVFASVTIAATEAVKASMGLRYFDRDARDSGNETGVFAGGTGPFVNSTSESGVTPRFGVEYAASERTLVFASIAKGYRNGGTQSPLPPQCAAEAAQVGVNVGGFDPDTTWNFEVGAKTELGGRATLNAAVYRIDWSDLQQTVRLGSCGFSRTGNLGEVRITGLELETQFAVNSQLVLGASLGLMNPKVVDPGVGTRSEQGDRPLNVAKINAAFNADFSFALTDRMAGFARLDYQHLGESFTTFNQNEPVPVTQTQPYRRRAPYDVVNVRAGVRPAERVEIAVYGRNLTDEAANFGEIAPIGIDRSDRPRYVTNRPRQFGIDVRFDF